jgi:hypothetical protein
MPGCAKCGERLEIVGNQVGRRETCPSCDSTLHACIHCRHFEVNVAKQCKEPFAEVPLDKEAANFCELFQLGEGGKSAPENLQARLSAAEALFKKP